MTKTIPQDLPHIPAPPTFEEAQAILKTCPVPCASFTGHLAQEVHDRVAKPAQALVDILSARVNELDARLAQKQVELDRAAAIIDEQAKALTALRHGDTVGTETHGDSTDPQQIEMVFEATIIQLNCFARIS